MGTCICSTCKNLKSIIDEIDDDNNDITEGCEFGFPSESCSECDEDHCELTCEHYIEDCEEEAFSISKCVKCGKELKVLASNAEAGEIYCPMCYLDK
ncbi:hypothetical protein [Niameybacter massiliensis]|uniref:hypothetical protein n=1 Tax=Niameybacter massiliensis TaxID=1658108 RepID=UPI0006B4060F|nr:hypothetical protein [Niameybacter massiliensis]